MRRKSGMVSLGILATVAAATMSGCSSSRNANYTEEGRCVDQSGRVLPDSACEGGSSAYTYPHWIYGGSVRSRRTAGSILSGRSEIGGYVVGGSSTPGEGATIVSRSGAIIRGGFGGSGAAGRSGGEGEGGHGGEGGGHGGAGE